MPTFISAGGETAPAKETRSSGSGRGTVTPTIAQGLETRWKDLPRAALESLALEAYRSQALTAAQLRRLLGFETRIQVDLFEGARVYDLTVADFEQDRETLLQLRAREAQL